MPLAALALLLAAPPAAQMPPAAADAACANVRVALPPELSGWSDRQTVSAGVKPGEGATVAVGRAVDVTLHPARHLQLAPAPAKPSDANGGTLALSIAEAGTYRIALGAGAWVDLVAGGKALASSAQGHGPKCSGVRKMVDYALQPGTYAIQLSGAAGDKVALMVAKLG